MRLIKLRIQDCALKILRVLKLKQDIFKSKAQARFMFAKHPKMAKEFASKTPSIKALPEKVK